MTRIAAMEIQALADLSPAVVAEAVAYFPYEQETFPYFTNWLNGVEPKYSLDDLDVDSGEDIISEYYSVTMRIVMGHLGEGYRGDRALDLYEYIPAILQFFRANPYLTCDAYTTALDYIGVPDIEITSGTGLRVFSNAGISAQQIGAEFTLRLPIMARVY